MFTQTYDAFNRQEKPELTLCNPDKTELYSLKSAMETVITMRYNATSEISLSFPREYMGEILPAFEHILQKRLIKVEDDSIGYFIITDVSTDDSLAVPIKTVRGLSLEFTMVAKRLTAFGGTYPLYDVLDPSSSLMGVLLNYIPDWSVGTIDSSLLAIYRTFDVSDTNIYNFLMNDVVDAFSCIFTFDTANKEISATTIANATTATDVYLSNKNIINSSTLKEITDEMTTALYCYGGGDLDILTVNPLGTNVIYNFDYYKDTSWMTQDLIDAIDAWEVLIATNQPTYASTLTSLKTSLGNLVVLEGELVTLNSEYLAIEGVQKVKIETGQDFSAEVILLAAKQVEIDSKQNEIDNENTTITSLRSALSSISTILSFDSNFSAAEQQQLSLYTYENTYKNDNLVQLDGMDADDVQDLSQELYDKSVLILARISQPRYEFEMDTVSILALKEYQTFTSQLQLGSEVLVEKEDETTLTLVLLEMIFDYDNPDGFLMTFSNRLRLANGAFVFSDLFGEPISTGSTVKFDKAKWGNWDTTHKDDVTNFITSSLDASVNSVINASNQEIKIYENGLRGRTYDDVTETYDDSQVWLTSKTLAFTDDNWNTAGLALGEITLGGTPYFGVVGGAIVGTILAGNSLSIQNENNNFLLDSTGAYLNDASFNLERSDERARITLDTTDGILIESGDGAGSYTTAFHVSTAGDLVFSGDLSGATGTFSGSIEADSGVIGGWNITSGGIEDATRDNYIDSDGYIKLGGLTITPTTASFSGTIQASKLSGEVQWSQITGAPLPNASFSSSGNYSADGINVGTLSGSRVYGGTISWPGASLGNTATGFPRIQGSSGVQMRHSGSSSWVEVGSGYVSLTATQVIVNGYLKARNRTYFDGGIYMYGAAGSSVDPLVGSSAADKRLNFTNGIFMGFSYV